MNDLLTSTESCKALFQSGRFVIEDSSAGGSESSSHRGGYFSIFSGRTVHAPLCINAKHPSAGVWKIPEPL